MWDRGKRDCNGHFVRDFWVERQEMYIFSYDGELISLLQQQQRKVLVVVSSPELRKRE